MSEKPVVVVTRKLPAAVESRLQADYIARLNPDDHLYSRDELLALATGADAILPCHTEKLDSDLIFRLPSRVRAIANFSVGVDHVDLEAARQRGIIVTNTPDVLADATAEVAILLMLGAARRASEGEHLIRSGAWQSWSPAFMVGTQVTGKRLGIVGMGRVGQVTARRARGFDMQIHYHNRNRLAADHEQGAQFHPRLEDLLSVSDFLALHCPATSDNIDMIGGRELALLPRGAILINTARGSLVDEDALIAALRDGHLAAAGLDVYKNEPDIRREFSQMQQMFLLPHIGSATRETRDAMGFRALDNLDAIFAGRVPRDRVA